MKPQRPRGEEPYYDPSIHPETVTVPEKDARPILWLPDGRALAKPPIGFLSRRKAEDPRR